MKPESRFRFHSEASISCKMAFSQAKTLILRPEIDIGSNLQPPARGLPARPSLKTSPRAGFPGASGPGDVHAAACGLLMKGPERPKNMPFGIFLAQAGPEGPGRLCRATPSYFPGILCRQSGRPSPKGRFLHVGRKKRKPKNRLFSISAGSLRFFPALLFSGFRYNGRKEEPAGEV